MGPAAGAASFGRQKHTKSVEETLKSEGAFEPNMPVSHVAEELLYPAAFAMMLADITSEKRLSAEFPTKIWPLGHAQVRNLTAHW
jgi:hypothetical protein